MATQVANGHELVTASADREFSSEELKAIREVYAPGANDHQFAVFIAECKRRKLMPGRQVFFTLRKSKEWDPIARREMEVKKPVYMTSIDALRTIAQRTGKYAGQKPLAWYYLNAKGEQQRVENIPLASQPYAAEAAVLRHDFTEPMIRAARWDASVQTYWKDNQQFPNAMWIKRGPEQLAKCAEAAALRAAFPEDLWGLYIDEEFQESDNVTTESHVLTLPAAPVASAPSAPAHSVESALPQKMTVKDVAERLGATLPPQVTPAQPDLGLRHASAPAQTEPFIPSDKDLPAMMFEQPSLAEPNQNKEKKAGAKAKAKEAATEPKPSVQGAGGFAPLAAGTTRAQRIQHLDKWAQPQPNRDQKRENQVVYYVFFCVPDSVKVKIEKKEGYLDVALWNDEIKKLAAEDREKRLGTLESAAKEMSREEFTAWALRSIEGAFGKVF